MGNRSISQACEIRYIRHDIRLDIRRVIEYWYRMKEKSLLDEAEGEKR